MDSLKSRLDTNDYRAKNLILYHYGTLAEAGTKRDSAKLLFNKMLQGMEVDTTKDADLIILKSIGKISVNSSSWVDGRLINQLHNTIRLAEKVKFPFIYEVYNVASGTYYKFGDTLMPIHYLKLAFNNYPAKKSPSFKAYYYNRLATCLIATKKWKEANDYLDSSYQIALVIKDTSLLSSIYERKKSIYAQSGDIAKQIYYQNRAFELKRKAGILTETAWNNQALNLQLEGKISRAIQYYNRALALAHENNNLYVLQSCFAGLYNSYLSLHNSQKAYAYLDSSFQAELLIVQKRESDKVADITLSYEQEKKDEQIHQLNQQASLQEKILHQQKITIISLGALMIAITAAGLGIFRQRGLRMENERLEAAWNKTSLEQRLLRIQMEPHFLFNLLADVQGLIRLQEHDKASQFLGKFSRLLRLNLENSRTGWVRLSDEIELLDNYMALQQMRNENSFDYLITVFEGFSEDANLIPPMLLQPFVENSILHGFNHIKYKGRIHIVIEKVGLAIKCVIDDNGTGLTDEKVAQRQSLSTLITNERLHLLSSQTKQPASLTIIDKSKENQPGVRVELVIPFKPSELSNIGI